MTTAGKPFTVFDALLSELDRAATYNGAEHTPPAAILWTDGDRQWEPLAQRLRNAIPHLVSFGDYAPSERRGPAIWLKCMVGRTLPEANWAPDVIPVLYLPKVSRHDLRAVEECPQPLQPLAELQYRGVCWTQVNGKDWTLLAFLLSIGLEVPRDEATLEALRRALGRIMDTPVADLQGKRLDAAFLNDLLNPDKGKRLLVWMNEPEKARMELGDEEWGAFRSICRKEFGFDPQTDGPIRAAELLGGQQGAWEQVWRRFAEAPASYPNLEPLLRKARPKRTGGLFDQYVRECWPQENESLEDELRSALANLPEASAKDSATSLLALEKAHSERRCWVWGHLGHAPLAEALRHLVTLEQAALSPLGGADVASVACAYAESGWVADSAALHALECAKSKADSDAVKNAVRILYLPWLEKTAARFQELFLQKYPHGGHCEPEPEALETGTVVLFADGLRMDIAHRLVDGLAKKGTESQVDWRWSPLPTVTPTAKPAVSPVSDMLTGSGAGEDFTPVVSASGKALTVERFRQLLADKGWQVLGADDLGDASGLAWAELGDLDHQGHQQGWKLAHRAPECLRALEERIMALLGHGWKRVRVVTDHGWLLLPGGLPKTEMPKFLAETRWGRCAVLKDTSVVKENVLPWYWNPDVRIMLAPGVSTFVAGMEYAHGGLTPQEAVVPVLTVQLKGGPLPAATITSVEWVGFRCRIQVETKNSGLTVALRTKAAVPESNIAKERPLDDAGQTSLLVEDDGLEHAAAFVVVLDPSGRLVAQVMTAVGE